MAAGAGLTILRTESDRTSEAPSHRHARQSAPAVQLACTAVDKVMVAEVLAFIERRTAELERS
jgi:hypothetical protein